MRWDVGNGTRSKTVNDTGHRVVTQYAWLSIYCIISFFVGWKLCNMHTIKIDFSMQGCACCDQLLHLYVGWGGGQREQRLHEGGDRLGGGSRPGEVQQGDHGEGEQGFLQLYFLKLNTLLMNFYPRLIAVRWRLCVQARTRGLFGWLLQ